MALDFDTFNERFAERFPDLAEQIHLKTWIEQSDQVALENFFQSLSSEKQVWFVRILWYLEDEQFNAICQLTGLNVTRERISDHRQPLVTFPTSLIGKNSNLACCLLAECLVKRLCSIKFNNAGSCLNSNTADVIIKELIAFCLPSRLILKPKTASDAGNGIYRALREQHINSKPGLELLYINLKNTIFNYCKDHLAEVFNIIGKQTNGALSEFIKNMFTGKADPKKTFILLMTILKRPIIIVDENEKVSNLAEQFQIQGKLGGEPFFLEVTAGNYKGLEVKSECQNIKLSNVLTYLSTPLYSPLVMQQYLSFRLAEPDINDQHRHLLANRSKELSAHTQLTDNLGLAASLLNPLEQNAMDKAVKFAFKTLNTSLLEVLLYPNSIPASLDIPLTPMEVAMNTLKDNNLKLTECTKKEWLIESQHKLLKLLLAFMRQWKASSKWPAAKFAQFEHTLILSKERAILNENGSSSMEAYSENTRIKWSQQSELVESVLIRMGKKIENFLTTRELSALEHAELYSTALRSVRAALLELNSTLRIKFEKIKKSDRDSLVNILTTMADEKKKQYDNIRLEHDALNKTIMDIEAELVVKKKAIVNDYFLQRGKNNSSDNREKHNDYTYKQRFTDTLFSGGFTADLTRPYFKWRCDNGEILSVTPIEWFILRYFPQRHHDFIDQPKENSVNIINHGLQPLLKEQSNLIDYKPQYNENNYHTLSWFARTLSKSEKAGLQINKSFKKESSTIEADNDFFEMLELKSDSEGEEHKSDLMHSEQNEIHQILLRKFPSERLLEIMGAENKGDEKIAQELTIYNIEKMLLSSSKISKTKRNDILSLILHSNDVDLICRILNHFDIKLTLDEINYPDTNCYNWTLLHKAIFYLHTPFCLQLLEQGASINMVDECQWTPGTMIVKLNRLFNDKMREIIAPYKDSRNSVMPADLQYDYLRLGSMRNGLRLVYEHMMRLVAKQKLANQLLISPYLKEMQTHLEDMKKELLKNSPGWLKTLLSPEKVRLWNENKSAYLRLNSSQKEAELARYFDDPLVIEVLETFPEEKQQSAQASKGIVVAHIMETTNKALIDTNHSPNSVTRKLNLLEKTKEENERTINSLNNQLIELQRRIAKTNASKSVEQRPVESEQTIFHLFAHTQNNNRDSETNSFQGNISASSENISNTNINVTPSLIN